MNLGSELDSLKLAFSNFNEFTSRLDKREQMALVGAGVFLVLFVLIIFLVMPVMGQRTKIKNAITIKHQQLTRMYDISAKIQAIEHANPRHAQTQGFTLMSFMEELGTKQGVKERIDYMKPVTGAPGESETIEVRLKGVFEDELIGLLYGIESSPTPLIVKYLNLRRNDKDKNLDVTFKVQVHG